MTTAIWLQRHRTIGRLLRVVPGFKSWLSRRVWADLLSRPGVREDLAAGQADLVANRTYVWDLDTGLVSANPNWPKDGPQPKPPYFMDRAV